MHHQAFQCAPQSISATHPLPSPFNDKHLQRRRKRGRKSYKKFGSHETVPPHSASASSWGIADPSEEEPGTSDSEGDEQYEQDSLIDSIVDGSEPARKRRHLEVQDVGRFASMSIDHSAPVHLYSDAVSPPLLPQVPPASPLPSPTGLKEMTATSIEEPEEEDDIAMRARRDPTTHQLDKNRYYVSSLSDESSDEEADALKARQERIDATLSSGPLKAQQDGGFLVNGELINRLQAIESQRRMALSRDRAFLRRRSRSKQSDESGSSTPNNRNDSSALVLWKKPEELSIDFSPQASPLPKSVQSLVLEEGNYAYVHRTPSNPMANGQTTDDAMEIDD